MIWRTVHHQADQARAYLSQRQQAHPQLSIAAVVLAVGVLATVLVAAYRSHEQQAQYDALLAALWSGYMQRHWDSTSGRSIDNQDSNVTTSEGQGYTMLRAVWIGDRSVFDKTWQWTEANLVRSDGLFSWRWGQRSDNSWGILSAQGGENSASDADTDIALALLLASARWHAASYRQSALRTVAAVWSEEVVPADGKLFIGADNLEKDSVQSSFVVNPSYVSPAAYHVFAEVDRSHDWNNLARQSYAFLHAANQAPLDVDSSSGLTPDWVRVDRATGAIIPPTDPGQTTAYGFNALRTPWRISLDWLWYRDPQAKVTLQDYKFLADQWQRQHMLYAIYTHDGRPAADYASLALYGGSLGYFALMSPSQAAQILQDIYMPLYDQQTQALAKPLSYYDNNWVWLGVALEAGKLPNLMQTGGRV